MPTAPEVRIELADILAKVQGCSPDAVQDERKLKEDLGVDSITIVEMGEELGRRFNLYLSDDAIDGMVTVKDAINAVVRHDGATPSSSSPAVPAKLSPNRRCVRSTPQRSEPLASSPSGWASPARRWAC